MCDIVVTDFDVSKEQPDWKRPAYNVLGVKEGPQNPGFNQSVSTIDMAL